MAFIRNPVEEQFELHKDDPRVQAILKTLGSMRKHVSHWEMNITPDLTRFSRDKWRRDGDQITYRVVLQDGQEIRGEILFVPQHNEWIASGTMIPVEIAKALRYREERKNGE